MKNRKFFICFILVCSFILLGFKEVYAYEYPTNALYFEYIDKTLGQVKVYIPQNQVSYLSFEQEDTFIVNVSASTCYGYFDYGGSEYRFTFGTFSQPYVRLSASSTYTYMQIEEVVSTNIDFLNEGTIYLSNENYYNRLMLYATVIGGFILCLIWLKK